jgi:hypothetical protein
MTTPQPSLVEDEQPPASAQTRSDEANDLEARAGVSVAGVVQSTTDLSGLDSDAEEEDDASEVVSKRDEEGKERGPRAFATPFDQVRPSLLPFSLPSAYRALFTSVRRRNPFATRHLF